MICSHHDYRPHQKNKNKNWVYIKTRNCFQPESDVSQERLRSVVSFSVGSMENTSENSTCKTNTQMRSCITMTYIGLRSMLWSVLYYIYVFVCFSECHDSTDRFKVRVWYFVFSSQTVHRKRSIAKIILWWVGRGKRLRTCVPTDWIVHVPVTHF